MFTICSESSGSPMAILPWYRYQFCFIATYSKTYSEHTLRWQLFAGTFFCDFCLNYVLWLKFAEMVQGRQSLMCYSMYVNVSGYKILHFWANLQKHQILIPAKNSHLEVCSWTFSTLFQPAIEVALEDCCHWKGYTRSRVSGVLNIYKIHTG